MTKYLGFIALVPRAAAGPWIQRHMPSPAVPVLQAFAGYAAWKEDQPILPAVGNQLVLNLSSTTYTAWQYTSHGGDVLAVACVYAHEQFAPSGKFAADTKLHHGVGVTLTEIVGEDLNEQMERALLLA